MQVYPREMLAQARLAVEQHGSLFNQGKVSPLILNQKRDEEL